ncbi:hypothetical protein Vlu01_14030 [Micromonospora lutea]|uniref:Uncharacterized protein n=1 Tax=Micromonospora lutea TaxID=419825 RepID=A0ABQ4IS86_9ACTN|nr:hypothetical protein Vlu01_14030 [Micromonospora lutea]
MQATRWRVLVHAPSGERLPLPDATTTRSVTDVTVEVPFRSLAVDLSDVRYYNGPDPHQGRGTPWRRPMWVYPDGLDRRSGVTASSSADPAAKTAAPR